MFVASETVKEAYGWLIGVGGGTIAEDEAA
jgi:hypothetical protein